MRELQLAFISNRMTKRLFRMLSIMEREREFTISEMAERLQVTQRTIASDLNHIRAYFDDAIALVSGYNGFLFEEKKPSLYQYKKQGMLDGECLFEIIGSIFEGKLLNIDELAHHYHFSESTFRRLLDQTTPILSSYELAWESNPLIIRGSEGNLRKFFKDFFYEGIETAYTPVPDSKLHDFAINKLSKKLETYEFGSGTTAVAFYYTLYITIVRARLGYSIKMPEYLVQLINKEKSFVRVFSLQSDLEKIFKVVLSKEEFAWMYLVTICKRTIDQEQLEDKFYQRFHIGSEISSLTNDYLEDFGFKQEHPQLITFLRSFFLSRKINHSIAPVLNKEAKDVKESLIRSDKENYLKNLHFLKKNQEKKFFSTPYLEDVCVSLTIYSDLIFDLYSPAKRIYFLLEGDHFICQQIRTRATQQFGKKHILIFLPVQYHTQERLNAEDIDLLVTNYNRYLLDFIIETDYLLIKAVPDDKDWRYLEKKIDPYRKNI